MNSLNIRNIAFMALLPLLSLSFLNSQAFGQSSISTSTSQPNYNNNPNAPYNSNTSQPYVMYPQTSVPPTQYETFPNSTNFNNTYERNQHAPR